MKYERTQDRHHQLDDGGAEMKRILALLEKA
jgi:hypothetical protein